MEVLIPLLSIFKDPVNMILILVIIFREWTLKSIRAEDRQDKEKMAAMIQHLDSTLDSVKNVLSAMSGKPV